MAFTTINLVLRILFTLLFFGAIGDCFSTNKALSLGAREANPLPRWFMAVLGPKWVLARLAMAIGSGAGVITAPASTPDWARIGILAVGDVLTWVAVVSNILLIRRLSRA